MTVSNSTKALSLGTAVDLYCTLLSITFCADLYAKRLSHSEATLVGSAPTNFKRHILQINGRVTEIEVEQFVNQLTFDPTSGNPLARPIIPTGDRLLLPGGLLRTSSVERTLLRSTAANPSTFGRTGERLGKLASRFADILQSELPCKAAVRLKMYRSDGTTLGDIDVLAWEESTSTVFALEVKWPVEALTIREGAKVEYSVQSGVRQLEKCQDHIRSGAGLKLPQGWPAWERLKSMNWHWYVATPGQIAKTDSQDIRSLSYRLLWANLPASTLQGLVRDLAWEPQLGSDFEIIPTEIETAGLSLRIDTLHLTEGESH